MSRLEAFFSWENTFNKWQGWVHRMYCKIIKGYKILEIKKGYIVVNLKTNGHSHFRSLEGCYIIIKLLLRGEFPQNTYLQESYRRLS